MYFVRLGTLEGAGARACGHGVWYAYYRTEQTEQSEGNVTSGTDAQAQAGCGGLTGKHANSSYMVYVYGYWYGHAGVRLGARSETRGRRRGVGRGDNAAGGCIDGCADGGDRRRIGIGIGPGRRDMNPTAGHGQDAGRWTAAGDRTRRHGANCDTPPSSQDRVVSWSWTWSWTGWASTCGRAVVVHLSAVRGRRNKE
ncbi:hypothetical protein OH76DRAFT_1242257 [Lentinus brumalis]|uniref:Uncharacterized protein n=1 Tax=Lentinus brumalis TaxID=2498619 RepID=A0A371CS71_9APHY|nr:hypothetical protein OH76DRAFT_1242257 [Polyporus brumalis]